ncbi:hypothetical protein COOONC_26611, partial [Cooperia oncophora]
MYPQPIAYKPGQAVSSETAFMTQIMASSILDNDGISLLKKINDILSIKAPEVVGLLDQFLGKLPLFINNVVESDKKERSIVLYGVPEAERGLSPSLRQAHRSYPAPRHRNPACRSLQDGFLFETLSKAHRLRAMEPYEGIFIRKSMSTDERKRTATYGSMRKGVFDYCSLSSDVLCLDLYLPCSLKHRLILVYRPPRSSTSQDEELIQIIQDLVSTTTFNSTVLGDLNLNINWESHLSAPMPRKEVFFRRDFKNADNDKIVHALTSIDWWSVFNSYVDIDDVYSRFIAILHEIIDRHVPLEQFERHSSSRYPKHVLNLFNNVIGFFHTLVEPSKSPLFRKVTKELEFHIKRFLTYKVKKMAACKHMKRLYEYINKVKKSPNLHKVLEDSEGIKYTTDSAKAEALADYFAS